MAISSVNTSKNSHFIMVFMIIALALFRKSQAITCAAGQVANNFTNSCCPKSTLVFNKICKNCTGGLAPNVNTNQCCPFGLVVINQVCSKCQTGQIANVYTNECCKNGTLLSSRVCTCPKGLLMNPTTKQCCGSGQIVINGVCSLCPNGRAPNIFYNKCCQVGEVVTKGICCAKGMLNSNFRCVCPSNQVFNPYTILCCPVGQVLINFKCGCSSSRVLNIYTNQCCPALAIVSKKTCICKFKGFQFTNNTCICRSGILTMAQECCPTDSQTINNTCRCPITAHVNNNACLCPSVTQRVVNNVCQCIIPGDLYYPALGFCHTPLQLNLTRFPGDSSIYSYTSINVTSTNISLSFGTFLFGPIGGYFDVSQVGTISDNGTVAIQIQNDYHFNGIYANNLIQGRLDSGGFIDGDFIIYLLF